MDICDDYRINDTGCFFLTVPPDFQYQNEKQVAANQEYFFKKFLMQKSSSLAGQVFSFWY